jgi:hypothetical protein
VPGQRRRRGVGPALHRRPDREAAAGITGLGLAGYVEGEAGEVKGRRGWTDGAGICSVVGVELTGSVGSLRVRPDRDGHVYFSLLFFLLIYVFCAWDIWTRRWMPCFLEKKNPCEQAAQERRCDPNGWRTCGDRTERKKGKRSRFA